MTKEKTDYQEKKLTLLNILISLSKFYVILNKDLLFVWRRFLSKQSDNRITHFFKVMTENPATALFINTILFAAIGTVFGGLINQVLFILSGLNIILFCASILGWKEKLGG